ncbi:tetratricopeptide repeat protein [Rhodalgimonas zhirmunskyi]|uniref:Tetratricopeptide repeat protein n=1 Tax=Rhodalgimonas zhirmunskyi TaxID=2964767 RepID=A0AAJ1UE30_9RHOB|nr:tetratricopeptide repeat protein [Rhodoalgimonas zhirmunskyi]MDQ2094631.1 tetratricopeptide repeat protein [Rhodoalgimonas zhirmunskyi]
MRKVWIIAGVVGIWLAGGVQAQCPPAPDHGVALARLIEQLRAAPDARMAQQISDEMWALWLDAPDPAAQALLDLGMHRREAGELPEAREALDELAAYCPAYAEGFNQRAFVSFIAGDYAAAVPDLDRALELQPTHLGALTGRAMALIALGRDDAARRDLIRAVSLNPWLAEKRLLDGLDGAAPGEKL